MTAGLSGIFPMLVTPFDESGAVALDELSSVTNYQLRAGVSGVSILGLAAEAETLTVDERTAIVRRVLSTADGIPVIVGCSAGRTVDTVLLARKAAEAGAAAVMVAPSVSGDWSREQLIEHYAAVARAIDPIPLMVQDAPAFVGVALDPIFVQELARAHANVQYAKPESVPASDAVATLAQLPSMGVFGGHGGLYFMDVLEAGADGLIPGCEQPLAFQRIYTRWTSNDRASARLEFERLLPLLVWQFQSLPCFIACVKTLLHAKGLLAHPSLRGRSWPLSSGSQGILLNYARRTDVA